MLEKGRISSRQFFFLIFTFILSNSLYNLPTISITQAKQDVWLAMLLALGIDAVVAVVLYILGLRYPQQTIFEYSESILGKVLGKLVALVFALFFLIMGSIILKTLTDFLTTVIMPETPMLAFSIIFLLVSTYAVNAGLEVLGRLSEIIGPVMLISLISVLLFNLESIEVARLQPAFQHSPLEIVKASLLPASWFGVCIAMGIFMAYHNKPKETLKVKLGGVVTGVVLLILGMLEAITVFGVEMCTSQNYLLYRLSQMIEVGDFFERFEVLEVFIWMTGGFISVIILYYHSTLGLAQLLRFPKYQSLTPFIGGIILFLSLSLFDNFTERLSLFKGLVFPFLALTVEGFLTTLLLIVSVLRHGKNLAKNK